MPVNAKRTVVTDSIESSYVLNDTTVTVYFGAAGYSADDVVSEGFNAYEIARFEEAFDRIEAVADVQFERVYSANQADFQLVLDTNEGGEYNDALGYFYLPNNYGPQQGIFNGAAWDRSAGGDLEVGGYGFVTVTHELLHGLGLAHPHDGGGGSGVMPGVGSAFEDSGTFGLNQGVFTTMSYNTGLIDASYGPAGSYAGGWGFEAGPMAIDIAVLQNLYGANETYNSGATTYALPGANAEGTAWTTIWDTGGTDTIRYDGNRDATIDLRAATLENEVGGGGFLSSADGIAGGVTIAYGVTIENATGGSGQDILQGNDAGNVLTGRGGRDDLRGEGGKDMLDGGDDDDTMAGNQDDDALYGGAGFDTLYGNLDDDILYGGAQGDLLNGGSGDDRLWGDDGNDRLIGGNGNDILNGGTSGDKLYGGSGADRLYGNRQHDALYGGSGADLLNGGSGRDRLWGDEGRDRLYGGTDRDMLSGGTADDRLYGGSGADRLFGNRDDDRLYGGDGKDLLNGGSGSDRLDGGTGDDTLKGGSGADSFVFSDGMDRDRIVDFAGNDTLVFDLDLVGDLDGAQIVDRFADVTDDGVLFDFGGGDTLLLAGVGSTDGLADNVSVFG